VVKLALNESNPCQCFGNTANGRNAVVKFAPDKCNACQQAMKLTITRFQRRTIRAAAKQIGTTNGADSHSFENCCELREKTDRRLTVTCEFSPFPKGTTARILKTIAKRLKKFIVRLLLWLHFPITH
jgi:hypothetical protein